MVPNLAQAGNTRRDSPRIRGDGPRGSRNTNEAGEFSPYSRGWSRAVMDEAVRDAILPVFAGMVPCSLFGLVEMIHSPRIRGDGPGRSRTGARLG